MAMDRIYPLQPTVTAGTAKTSPMSFNWPMEDAYLQQIEIVAPPGPSGLVGIRIKRAGTVILPYSNDVWLIMNDDKFPASFNEQITRAGLVVEMYNTDIYDHTFYLRATVSDLAQPLSATESSAITANDVLSQLPTIVGG